MIADNIIVNTIKKWGSYFNSLFPSPQQSQSIANRRVIDQLKKHGDSLTKEREVFHWIYFKTEKDRESYLDKIKNDNFTVVNKQKGKGKYRYGLEIKRVDKVDLDSVDKYVIYLWRLANETNGDYDGWETSVEE
ncbi:MAG: ribonuclease E inhibitor RraB [Lentimicrobiaceae bacterium]|nr:ribonuclease E inhibitor RraB [Lentimicrobiaceae bacterium]